MGIPQSKRSSFNQPTFSCAFMTEPLIQDATLLEVSVSSYSGFAKILILGDCGVGKSCLLKGKNFVRSDTNRDKYFSIVSVPASPTQSSEEDEPTTTCMMAGSPPQQQPQQQGGVNSSLVKSFREILLETWDISEQCIMDEYRNFQCKPFRGVNAVFVCFDVNSPSSWVNVKRWLGDIDRFVNSSTMRIIVGCKADQRASLNMFQSFKEKKKNRLMKLICDCPDLISICKEEIFNIISPYLSIEDFLKLRIVSKGLYNATIKRIKEKYCLDDELAKVSEEEVQEYAEQSNAKVFYTSAKYHYGVDELFLTVMTSIVEEQH